MRLPTTRSRQSLALGAVVAAAAGFGVMDVQSDLAVAVRAEAAAVVFALSAVLAARSRPAQRIDIHLSLIAALLSLAGCAQTQSMGWLHDLGVLSVGTPIGVVALLVARFPSRSIVEPRMRIGLVLTWAAVLLVWPVVMWPTRASASRPTLVAAIWTVPGVALVAYELGRRWRQFTRPARRVVVQAYVGAAATYLGVLVHDAWLSCVVLAFGAGALLAAVLRTRVTSATLGDLVDSLARNPGAAEVQAAIARALGDPSLVLGFHTSHGLVDADGRDLAPDPGSSSTDVLGEAGPIATLIHDPALSHDPGLVDAVAGAARFALQNAQLRADLRGVIASVDASRSRLAQAAARERQEIERRLSEGPMRHLVQVQACLREAASDLPEELAQALRQAGEEADLAWSEMVALVHGLQLDNLDEDGIAPLIRDLAARSPVATVCDIDAPKRLLPEVERSVYFLVAEGLQNVAKYASAQRATVRLRTQGSDLIVDVVDDGVGGAHLDAGSGLLGIRDRVAAAGGVLDLESAPGGGTRLSASFADAVPADQITA